jgi:hypothetical protein
LISSSDTVATRASRWCSSTWRPCAGPGAVLEGADELGRVDHAALQRREDLAARQHLHVHAQVGVDLAGQAGDAHLQALQVGDGLDLLLEPARHLHAGVAAGHGHHAEGRVDLVPQVDAAAVVEPAVHALEVHAEGHGGEVLRGEGLAGPEVAVGVVHLHRAGAHRVEAFEGRDQLAGAEDLDVQPAARHLADALGQVGGRARAVHVERRALAVGRGHLPVEASR